VVASPSSDLWAEVMASWRDSGGEPNIARSLPELFQSNGLVVRRATPLVFAARPGQPMWRWPAAFLRTGAARLRALGRVDDAWVESVGAPRARLLQVFSGFV
jgi:hypothetical protein